MATINKVGGELVLIKTFDNKINIVGDDLKASIEKGSKLSTSHPCRQISTFSRRVF